MSIVLGILTFILILVSLFLILVVLMQKTKDSGVGAALGGGAAEAAFGAETGNVLTKMTKYSAILFFVLAFALYLGRIYERKHTALDPQSKLPEIVEPAALAPATPPTDATMPGAAINVPSAAAPTTNAPVTTDAAAPATEATPAPTPQPADTSKQP